MPLYDFLSEQGQHELIEHKTLGLYLAIAMGVIALLKIIGCKMKKFGLEALAVILLFAATATTFAQGKMGGELVYNYGMPFKSYTILKTLKKASVTAGESESTDEKVEVYIADEAFLTGTAAEITPVRIVDAREIGCGSRGAMTEKLQTLYFDIVFGRNKEYEHYLTYVN